MNRRGFMRSILAAGVAPYVVTTAGVLMPVRAIAAPRIICRGLNFTALGEGGNRPRAWPRQDRYRDHHHTLRRARSTWAIAARMEPRRRPELGA